MKITARFIGENGSLGFQHGKVYELRVSKATPHPFVITDIERHVHCPYSSIEAFLNNWTDIVTDKW